MCAQFLPCQKLRFTKMFSLKAVKVHLCLLIRSTLVNEKMPQTYTSRVISIYWTNLHEIRHTAEVCLLFGTVLLCDLKKGRDKLKFDYGTLLP